MNTCKTGQEKETTKTTFQSVCRWSFHAGKGGFVPANIRPELAGMTPERFVALAADKIKPRVPKNVQLGLAVHYDKEIDEKTAESFAKALCDRGLCLSMVTPGAHYHFAYGGIGSLDPKERKKAREFSLRTMDLMLGPLAIASDNRCPAVFDIWNGSMGYEIPSVLVMDMLKYADDAIAEIIQYAGRGQTQVRIGVEPKPNEGHSAMLYQTSGEVLALRGRLRAAGLNVSDFGLINEFGHTEMAGLELAQEYAAAAMENAIIHVHANSQGADGVRLGGAGKFDIDYGLAPTSTTIAIAHILHKTKYCGWIEHDMQPRPYDSAEQNINRVVRSICNWEAVNRSVSELDSATLQELAVSRDMMEFEDLIRDTLVKAHGYSLELYKTGKKGRNPS